MEDNTNGIIKVANYGRINEHYNIGSNYSLTNIELVKKICNIFIKEFYYSNKILELIKHVKDRPGHDRNYGLDARKLRRLNWKCNSDFNDSMKKTIAWYLK